MSIKTLLAASAFAVFGHAAQAATNATTEERCETQLVATLQSLKAHAFPPSETRPSFPLTPPSDDEKNIQMAAAIEAGKFDLILKALREPKTELPPSMIELIDDLTSPKNLQTLSNTGIASTCMGYVLRRLRLLPGELTSLTPSSPIGRNHRPATSPLHTFNS
jgi:hypothetical protein